MRGYRNSHKQTGDRHRVRRSRTRLFSILFCSLLWSAFSAGQQGLSGRPQSSDFSGDLAQVYRGPWGTLPDYQNVAEKLREARGETRPGPARTWKAVLYEDRQLYVTVGPMPPVKHPDAPDNYHLGWRELIVCDTFACPEKNGARYLFYMARKVEGDRETIQLDIAVDRGRSHWGLQLAYEKETLVQISQVWVRYRAGQPEPIRLEIVDLRKERFVVRDGLSFEGGKRIPRSQSWMLRPALIPASLRRSVLPPDFHLPR